MNTEYEIVILILHLAVFETEHFMELLKALKSVACRFVVLQLTCSCPSHEKWPTGRICYQLLLTAQLTNI